MAEPTAGRALLGADFAAEGLVALAGGAFLSAWDDCDRLPPANLSSDPKPFYRSTLHQHVQQLMWLANGFEYTGDHMLKEAAATLAGALRPLLREMTQDSFFWQGKLSDTASGRFAPAQRKAQNGLDFVKKYKFIMMKRLATHAAEVTAPSEAPEAKRRKSEAARLRDRGDEIVAEARRATAHEKAAAARRDGRTSGRVGAVNCAKSGLRQLRALTNGAGAAPVAAPEAAAEAQPATERERPLPGPAPMDEGLAAGSDDDGPEPPAFDPSPALADGDFALEPAPRREPSSPASVSAGDEPTPLPELSSDRSLVVPLVPTIDAPAHAPVVPAPMETAVSRRTFSQGMQDLEAAAAAAAHAVLEVEACARTAAATIGISYVDMDRLLTTHDRDCASRLLPAMPFRAADGARLRALRQELRDPTPVFRSIVIFDTARRTAVRIEEEFSPANPATGERVRALCREFVAAADDCARRARLVLGVELPAQLAGAPLPHAVVGRTLGTISDLAESDAEDAASAPAGEEPPAPEARDRGEDLDGAPDSDAATHSEADDDGPPTPGRAPVANAAAEGGATLATTRPDCDAFAAAPPTFLGGRLSTGPDGRREGSHSRERPIQLTHAPTGRTHPTRARDPPRETTHTTPRRTRRAHRCGGNHETDDCPHFSRPREPALPFDANHWSDEHASDGDDERRPAEPARGEADAESSPFDVTRAGDEPLPPPWPTCRLDEGRVDVHALGERPQVVLRLSDLELNAVLRRALGRTRLTIDDEHGALEQLMGMIRRRLDDIRAPNSTSHDEAQRELDADGKTLDLLCDTEMDEVPQCVLDELIRPCSEHGSFLQSLVAQVNAATQWELNDTAALGVYRVGYANNRAARQPSTLRHQHVFGVVNLLLCGAKDWIITHPKRTRRHYEFTQKAGDLLFFPAGKTPEISFSPHRVS